MSEEIKSAREIALEKVARLGQATEEESLRWRYVPEGETLAAKYLKKPCVTTSKSVLSILIITLGQLQAKAAINRGAIPFRIILLAPEQRL